ncbi:MAG: pyruvate kinase [Candidatus Uhrbacteria bacterium]
MIQKKRTKIVCTIGPASASEAVLKKMVKAGMNVARLNFSHGTYKEHRNLIKHLRAVEKITGEPIGILGDLQGPKIRVGDLPIDGWKIIKGETIELPVTYPNLYQDIKKGDRVLIEDGLMDGECVGGRKGFLKIKIRVGGTLFSHKGLNFPDSTLKIDSLTEKDKKDAAFCVQSGLHFVAMSFVVDPADVRSLRKILKKAADPNQPIPMIIAKIEKHEAVRQFDEILKEVDAVMVARGDLGVEIPAEQVPLVQKEIIEKCRAAGKPVIVATQMLDSMIRNPRPTRAEVSDVANAVIDHTDAVMLSGETATGKYPVEAVATMTKIIQETEASSFDDLSVNCESHDCPEAITSHTLRLMAKEKQITSALAANYFNPSAPRFNLLRPELSLFVAVSSEVEVRQLNLRWGIEAFLLKKCSEKVFVQKAIKLLKQRKMLARKEKLAVILGQENNFKILKV